MSYFGSGSSERWPPAVKNIIIINVIMVIAQFSFYRSGINLSDKLALHYWSSPDFKWWQFFTHMFMHGNPTDFGQTIQHIFFNMFGLWMFGAMLENMWGTRRFVIFYLICGLGAAFCHLGVLTVEFASFHRDFLSYQMHPGVVEFTTFITRHHLTADANYLSLWRSDPNNPTLATNSVQTLYKYYLSMGENTSMVGASGAVFGVLFAFAYMFPNTELYIMFIPIPVKAKWAVTGYAAIELFSGVGRFENDNVAHFAHLGGMLFAFIVLRIWKINNRNRIY